MTRRALPRADWALIAAALLLAPKIALAQAPAEAQATDEEPPEPGSGTPRPPAPDWRRGTFLLSVGGAYVAPLGETSSALAASSLVSGGPGFAATLGLGLSRYLSMELQGSYGKLGGGEACAACSGDTIGLGLGFAYHLAQGIAFDPWGSFGVGFRTSTIAGPETTVGETILGVGRYQGIDFARVALGGEFYPLPILGFGPYLEASVGSYRIRPDTQSAPSVYAFLSIGLRVTLDPLRGGKVARSSTVASRERPAVSAAVPFFF